MTIVELADKLGIDRSNVRKYILKSGFKFIKVRTEESRHQLTLALKKEDAEALIKLRVDQGFTLNMNSS